MTEAHASVLLPLAEGRWGSLAYPVGNGTFPFKPSWSSVKWRDLCPLALSLTNVLPHTTCSLRHHGVVLLTVKSSGKFWKVLQ